MIDSAKYAARLGQSFGSSKETLKVKADDIELIPDKEQPFFFITAIYSFTFLFYSFLLFPEWSPVEPIEFSYGIGKISSEFAELVARKCNIKGDSPSICFSN
ncbi:hypothetical protein HID58_044222 [Brassica napus]|uniref:RNA-dependent RNA polymerase n=1 Tax=Brassica napus TaxID=3708 RepID=A0ABQ8BIS3_BRANA|nr:hypothetical protein HID58_044222 [Brassica napus]